MRRGARSGFLYGVLCEREVFRRASPDDMGCRGGEFNTNLDNMNNKPEIIVNKVQLIKIAIDMHLKSYRGKIGVSPLTAALSHFRNWRKPSASTGIGLSVTSTVVSRREQSRPSTVSSSSPSAAPAASEISSICAPSLTGTQGNSTSTPPQSYPLKTAKNYIS